MINKKSFTSAFTLIELLVVITIIGILAGIALPVFNSVQTKGAQTKALAQAKQIGLALKLFASDNDGTYPKAGIPIAMAAAPTNSNVAFGPLFPQYLQNETIFANKLVTGSIVPDNKIDSPYTGTRTDTLKTGENVYGYMMGLNDAMNSSCPLVFDGTQATFDYSTTAGGKGNVWGGLKAVVIHLDNSGVVQNTVVTGTAGQVQGTDSTGAAQNALDPSKGAYGMASAAQTCLLPDL